MGARKSARLSRLAAWDWGTPKPKQRSLPPLPKPVAKGRITVIKKRPL